MSVLSKRKIEFREDFAVGMIIGIVVLAVTIMVAVGVTIGSPEQYNDDYFVTDGTKLVLSMDKEVASYEEGEYEPEYTHLVYYYLGNSIKSVRIFYEYDYAALAEEANQHIALTDKEWAISKKQSGKYIVFELAPTEFEGLTTNNVKEDILSMKAAGGTATRNTE